MKLRVVHRTFYAYAGEAIQSFNEARLRPVTDETQRCLEYRLHITPPAGSSREYHDFHGNHVHYFEVNEPHEHLIVESNAIVETLLENPFNFNTTLLKGIPPAAMEPRSDEWHEYLLPSNYVPLAPEIWRWALDACDLKDDFWTLANRLTQRVHQHITYQPGSTTVHTSAVEALEKRTGVCQDYAHVLLGLLRSLKIPARYVSGYIFETTGMPIIGDGGGDLASHAWCEIYIPDVGWRGLDATNGLVANDHYVKLAVGRDYADAAPLKGGYRGPPTRDLKVAVSIEHLAD